MAVLAFGLAACVVAAFLLGFAGTTVAVAIVLATAIFLLVQRSREFVGAANAITFARASLAAILAGFTVDTFFSAPPAGDGQVWLMVGLAAVALLLDGIDGSIARRSGTADSFGARFDMEVDAFLVLTLSVLAAVLGKAGMWIVLAGFLRYAFVAASFAYRPLAAPLPESLRRKTVCVVQIGALSAILMPVLQPPASGSIGAAALLVLFYSFAVDILWSLRRRPVS